MSRKKTNRGFTLIEMLVALAIILMIVTMVYGSYAATTRSMDACSTRMDCSERAYLVLRLMARHIRGTYVPAADPNAAESSEARTPTARAVSEPSGRLARVFVPAPAPWFRGDSQAPQGRILTLVTTGGPGAGPDVRRGLSRVTYLYDKSAATLSIRQENHLNTLGSRRNTEIAQPILDNVAKLALAFYDGQRWQEDWNYDQNERLPSAVKIELTINDSAGRARRYETIAPVLYQVHTQRNGSTGSVVGR